MVAGNRNIDVKEILSVGSGLWMGIDMLLNTVVLSILDKQSLKCISSGWR